jgi:hypothetical protein
MHSTSTTDSFQTALDDFKLDGLMLRYSAFMPRLYNYCLSLGMEPGKIMPSRAFCSDESQGFPIILIAKQFGAFPFNHGRVGGIVATNRHAPHASHGKDLVIIQASHVGFDPASQSFGHYRRLQTKDAHHGANCGKIAAVISWYQDSYRNAQNNLFLEADSFSQQISISNQLLEINHKEGLFLDLNRLIARNDDNRYALSQSLSTTKTFQAAPELIARIGQHWPTEQRQSIDKWLTPDLFHFQREFVLDTEGQGRLESNLLEAMPWIVADKAPALAAAQINTQIEFDQTYRTILQEPSYQERNLLFISGINIDISPNKGQIFPLTKFIPWAAYIQSADGSQSILEQQALFDNLMACESNNPNQIDLEAAISEMEGAEEIHISFDFRK